jgi:DNA-binding CsgD family transcriptional regulator
MRQFQLAINAFQRANHEVFVAVALNNLGLATARAGDAKAGLDLIRDAMSRHLRLGFSYGVALSHRYLAQILASQEEHQAAESHFRQSLRIDLDKVQGWHICSSLEGLAAISAKQNDVEQAIRWLSAAASLRSEIGVPVEPALRRDYEELLVDLRHAAGERVFGDLWAIGSRLNAGEVVAEAVETRATESASMQSDPSSSNGYGLTARELDVLRHLADGLSNPQIADALFISPRTAGTHVANILRKMEVENRSAAVATAWKQNLI